MFRQLDDIDGLGGIEQFVIDDLEKSLNKIEDDLQLDTVLFNMGDESDEELNKRAKTLEDLGRMADRIVNLWNARDKKLIK